MGSVTWSRWRVWLGSAVLLTTMSSSARAEDVRLVDAVKARRWEAARALVSRTSINARQPDGATALLWSAQWDHVPTAELLIRHGADVSVGNDYGVTPLFFAASNGSIAMTRVLLEAGARPDAALPSGETALMTAARTGRLDVVDQLVAKGASINAAEHELGQTALMWALSERHLDVVRMLVARGADVQAQSKAGYTPLMFATRQGDQRAVQLLLDRGVNVNIAAEDGTTPLHMAVVRGHLELAEMLLAAGADPNADRNGYTPLHWAAGTWESAYTRDYRVREWAALVGYTGERRLRLLAALFAHGANPNARATRFIPRFGSSAWKIHGGGTPIGATPFFFAASVGDTTVMRVLLAHGADPHLTTKDNTTPLMAAAGLAVEESETSIPERDHLDAVRLLLDLGADVHATNGPGDTPLHAAAFLGYTTIAELLLDRGATLNVRNKLGQTPYRVAAGIMVTQMFFQHPATAAFLKQRGGTD